jgi:hypothetical protein
MCYQAPADFFVKGHTVNTRLMDHVTSVAAATSAV